MDNLYDFDSRVYSSCFTWVNAISAMGDRLWLWWNSGMVSTMSRSWFLEPLRVFDPSAKSTPFTAQCGYFAACKIILAYATVSIETSPIFYTKQFTISVRRKEKLKLQPSPLEQHDLTHLTFCNGVPWAFQFHIKILHSKLNSSLTHLVVCGSVVEEERERDHFL